MKEDCCCGREEDSMRVNATTYHIGPDVGAVQVCVRVCVRVHDQKLVSSIA